MDHDVPAELDAVRQLDTVAEQEAGGQVGGVQVVLTHGEPR